MCFPGSLSFSSLHVNSPTSSGQIVASPGLGLRGSHQHSPRGRRIVRARMHRAGVDAPVRTPVATDKTGPCSRQGGAFARCSQARPDRIVSLAGGRLGRSPGLPMAFWKASRVEVVSTSPFRCVPFV